MNKINGRTLEEIKKGLECYISQMNGDCLDYESCRECPHYDPCSSNGIAACGDVLALIRHLEAAQPEWISVAERLPDDSNERVLVILNYDIIVGEPKIDTDRYCDGVWRRYGSCVTHWMPLSKLPEPSKE